MKEILALFDSYAAALSRFSSQSIADHYNVPCTVFHDKGSRIFNSREEIAAFFEQGMQAYKDMDVINALPKTSKLQQVSEGVYFVRVKWSNRDSIRQVSEETFYYIINDVDGILKISGVIPVTDDGY